MAKSANKDFNKDSSLLKILKIYSPAHVSMQPKNRTGF